MNKINHEEKYRKEAERLISNMESAKQLLNIHRPSIGYVGESLLRRTLNRLLPHNVGICQGFICATKNGNKDRLSKQCDIIIYQKNNSSILYSCRDLKVVKAESVIAVIEVKSSINKKTFFTTLEAFQKLH